MKPELVILDLDYTLWDAGGTWCDCLSPPFRQTDRGPVDRYDALVHMYDEIPEIIEYCLDHNITLGIASRTHAPDWAMELLKMLNVLHHFEYREIFPDSKVTHFNHLKRDSGIDFEKMLFFDDEMRNIIEVGNLGVTAVHVSNGLDMNLFQEGLALFLEN